MCLESPTISISLKIKINMEYIDKTKINMKYIDKNKEGRRIMHIQKQEITLNINYSSPYQPLVQFRKEKLVQFREKYDK